MQQMGSALLMIVFGLAAVQVTYYTALWHVAWSRFDGEIVLSSLAWLIFSKFAADFDQDFDERYTDMQHCNACLALPATFSCDVRGHNRHERC